MASDLIISFLLMLYHHHPTKVLRFYYKSNIKTSGENICNSKGGFTPCKTEQSLQGMESQEKEAQNKLKHTGNFLRKNLQLINSRLKAI